MRDMTGADRDRNAGVGADAAGAVVSARSTAGPLFIRHRRPRTRHLISTGQTHYQI